jgi:hypothetical protein
MIAVSATTNIGILAVMVVRATSFGTHKSVRPIVIDQVFFTTIVIFEFVCKFKNVLAFKNIHN